MMKSRMENYHLNTRRLFHIIGLCIGGIIFLWQLVKMIIDVRNNTVNVEISFSIVWAVIILLIVRLVQIVNWNNLMASVGYHIPFKEVISNYSLVLLPRYIPGGIWGYISRGEWLNKQYKVSYGTTNFISAVEIGIVVISSLQITILFVFETMNIFPLEFTILICLALFLIPFGLIKQGMIRTSPGSFVASLKKAINPQPIPLSRYFISWILSVIIWVGYGIALTRIASLVNVIVVDPVITYTFVFSLAWLIGFIILFIPSGLGIREQSMVFLLMNTQTIGLSSAIIISVWMRGLMLISELAYVAIGLLEAGKHNIKKDTTIGLL